MHSTWICPFTICHEKTWNKFYKDPSYPLFSIHIYWCKIWSTCSLMHFSSCSPCECLRTWLRKPGFAPFVFQPFQYVYQVLSAAGLEQVSKTYTCIYISPASQSARSNVCSVTLMNSCLDHPVLAMGEFYFLYLESRRTRASLFERALIPYEE